MVGLHQLRREVQTVQERAEELHTLACAQEFSYLEAIRKQSLAKK